MEPSNASNLESVLEAEGGEDPIVYSLLFPLDCTEVDLSCERSILWFAIAAVHARYAAETFDRHLRQADVPDVGWSVAMRRVL